MVAETIVFRQLQRNNTTATSDLLAAIRSLGGDFARLQAGRLSLPDAEEVQLEFQERDVTATAQVHAGQRHVRKVYLR